MNFEGLVLGFLGSITWLLLRITWELMDIKALLEEMDNDK